MSIYDILAFLGFGTLMWCVGRISHHLLLCRVDSLYNQQNPDVSLSHVEDLRWQDNSFSNDKKCKFYYFTSLAFYIFGTVSSLIIGIVDGLCRKRLYRNHVVDMKILRRATSDYYNGVKNCKDYDDIRRLDSDYHFILDLLEIGSSDPVDLPDLWYSLKLH